MVMPERLPGSLPSSPEGPASAASAGRVVAAPVVASAEFTAGARRRSFTAKYKLQILPETDRVADTGGISTILRREGLYSSALSDWRGQREAAPWARFSHARAGRKRLRRTLCRLISPRPIARLPLCAAGWIRRKRSSPSKKSGSLAERAGADVRQQRQIVMAAVVMAAVVALTPGSRQTAAICTALAVSRASMHRHRVALTAPPRAQNTAGTFSACLTGK